MKTLKSLLLGSCLIISGIANADEIATASSGASTGRWTGAFVGINLGSAVHKNKSLYTETELGGPFDTQTWVEGDNKINALLGGVSVGYDKQYNQFVFGVQGQYNMSDLSGSNPYIDINQNNDDIEYSGDAYVDTKAYGTLTARLGYLVGPSSLVFVKGGGAYARFDYTDIADGQNVYSDTYEYRGSRESLGWAAGIGIEQAISENISLVAEYDYMDFGSETVTLSDVTGDYDTEDLDITNTIQTFNIGLNYRF